MAFSFLPFVPQQGPRIGFDTLNQALSGVVQDRHKAAQRQILVDQMAQKKRLAEQAATAKLARQKIEDKQWQAKQDLATRKQDQLEGYQDATLEGAQESRDLSRQKAVSGFQQRVREALEAGATDEQLAAFIPEARALGIELPTSRPAPELELPDYDQSQAPEDYARGLDQQIGQAVDAAVAAPEAPASAQALMPGVPLDEIRQQQTVRSASPISTLAQNIRPQDRGAYRTAESVVPFLQGTPTERIEQALKIGREIADREAAWRRAQMSAAQRGEASGRAERSLDEQQYDRGLKQFKSVMTANKNKETVDKLAVLKEATGKLVKGPDGKINPASAMEAFYMIAKAREGGRLTEEDFQRSFGLQDVRTKLTNWVRTGVEAQLSDTQIKRTLGMLKSNYKDAVVKMKRDYRAAERLLKRLPEGPRRTAVEDMIDTTFGGMEFYQKLKQGSGGDGKQVPGDISSLLNKAEASGS